MSMLSQRHLDSVVYIKTNTGAFGTGFMIGVRVSDIPNEDGRFNYSPFLVTNKHVVEGAVALDLTVNTETNSHTTNVLSQNWIFAGAGIDLAVMPLNASYIQSIKSEGDILFEDNAVTSKEAFLEEIVTGQEVFLLGFPLNLVGKKRTYPIARMGIVARNDEELVTEESIFLLDINNFPGNSGGPVFSKPSIESIDGKKPLLQSKLIGLIMGYKPSKKTLYDITVTPYEPKMVIEENSGIAIGIPVYLAFELARKKIEEDSRVQQKLTPSVTSQKALKTV